MAVFIDENENVLTQEEVDVLWKIMPNDIKEIVDVGIYTKDEAIAKTYKNVISIVG